MLPLAGGIVRRLGPATAVLTAAAVGLAGLFVMGVAPEVWLLAAGMWLLGSGVGVWDVAMNVEAAEVERRLGRDIMPRFHAGFSLGTVGGAGVGALAAAGDVPVRVHLPAVAVVVMIGVVVAVRRFLPDRHAARPAADAAEPGAPRGRRPLLAAWLEPRTLLIGVMVFSMALAEGSANDWLALAVVDGYGAVHAVGCRRVRRLRHRDDGDAAGRALAARPLRPGRRRPRQRPAGARGQLPGRRGRRAGRRARRHARPRPGAARRAGLGRRRGARVPAGHDRRGRRPGALRRPGWAWCRPSVTPRSWRGLRCSGRSASTWASARSLLAVSIAVLLALVTAGAVRR